MRRKPRSGEQAHGPQHQVKPAAYAARQFTALDSYVVQRLRTLRVKRKGRNLRPGEARAWSREYFENLGSYRLRGTIRYPARLFWEVA